MKLRDTEFGLAVPTHAVSPFALTAIYAAHLSREVAYFARIDVQQAQTHHGLKTKGGINLGVPTFKLAARLGDFI